jgi:hypothetical protein
MAGYELLYMAKERNLTSYLAEGKSRGLAMNCFIWRRNVISRNIASYLAEGKSSGLSGVLARGTKEDDLLEPLLTAA